MKSHDWIVLYIHLFQNTTIIMIYFKMFDINAAITLTKKLKVLPTIVELY